MPHSIYEDPDNKGFYKVIWVSEEDYKIIQDRERKERERGTMGVLSIDEVI